MTDILYYILAYNQQNGDVSLEKENLKTSGLYIPEYPSKFTLNTLQILP